MLSLKGRNVVSLKRLHFSLCYCVFFPTVMQILVGRLDSYLLTHTKKYMTPIHALIFEKHVKMCVYIRHIKKPVQIHNTFGRLRTAKTSWLGGHFFRTWVRRVRGA